MSILLALLISPGIFWLQIKEYFCSLIGSSIEASVRSVRAFVKQYLVRVLGDYLH